METENQEEKHEDRPHLGHGALDGGAGVVAESDVEAVEDAHDHLGVDVNGHPPIVFECADQDFSELCAERCDIFVVLGWVKVEFGDGIRTVITSERADSLEFFLG